jgi:hypothetical protein
MRRVTLPGEVSTVQIGLEKHHHRLPNNSSGGALLQRFMVRFWKLSIAARLRGIID